MKVRMSGSNVEIKPTTLADYEVFKTFPGLLKMGGRYFCASKGPVVRNVLKRLRKYENITLDVDPSVEKFLSVGKLDEIPSNFGFRTEPLKHQMIALRFLSTNRGGGLLLDPGLGKTKVCCDFMWIEKFKRSLVVCPKPLLFVWQEEIQTHRPELTYHVFESTDWDAEYAQAKDKDVWVMNYRKVSILIEALLDISFDALLVDEGLVKSVSSDQTDDITRIAYKTPVRVIMSGTLVNNTAADVFAPVRILEPSLVGTSFSKFRDEYLQTWCPDKNNKHLKAVSGAKDPGLLKEILHTCSIVMRKEEWLQLPKKHFHYIEVNIGEDAEDAYYKLLRNYALRLEGKEIVVDNPLSMMAKLSQFGNGFVYLDDDVGAQNDLLLTERKSRKKKRTTHYFKSQPKIDSLRGLLNDQLLGKKAVVWYTMDAERVLIQELLTELRLPFVTVAGGDKSIPAKVREFNTNPDMRIMLCQAKTLNYGVTLLGRQCEDTEDMDEVITSISTAIYTQVFYSLTYSLEVFLQQQDRIHRIGQKNECHYYILVANTPTEQKLVKALEDKQDIREFMLDSAKAALV